MKLIAHRRNTLAELESTPVEYGVEIDVRSRGSRLVLHHEPFVDGTDFVEWLAQYRHGTLILNVKEEGLEDRLLALMAERNISDFFFLDQSFPFLIKTARRGERRCAVRLSEFESIQSVENVASLIDWVWVDCFSRLPLTGAEAGRLKRLGLRLCLVSPELQGRTGAHEIPEMRAVLRQEDIHPDAVCTKVPALWQA